ncbi:metallophosphoesterase [Methylomonas sp. MS20]|uniref:metallophosphoesterase n=1 Tax=unclassified Methylomonas TaxID=2608980 RepID=UPI0028A4D701|nr:metallophosphoesterase [Methylomonas sp. MV1]MDT4331621.1 metallophosphoesterase [Methylomonas sp. MV1]
MKNKLTWLHLSDIHFHPKTKWRDSVAQDGLIEYLGRMFADEQIPRPDLIFCTGDIAFGETGCSPLAEQYEDAQTFFDELLKVCGQDGKPFPKERLFVVPGNHDVNRDSVNSDAQETLTRWAKEETTQRIGTINQRFEDRSTEFKDAIKRLDEYSQFINNYLPFQADADGRHCYARIVDIDGLSVGIAGFNSAWTCAGPEDDRTVWLAAEWQFNAAQTAIKNADIRIGLIHHPVDWLNQADRDIATSRISKGFHFWLHGHSHNQWLEPGQNHVTIAAGAVGAEHSEEFGINLVSIDLATRKGVADLHEHKQGDSDWKVATIGKHAPRGQWLFDIPDGIKAMQASAPMADDLTIAAPPLTEQETQTPPPVPLPVKREFKLYGRDQLIKNSLTKLNQLPFLLVYGLRGNGKSKFIETLGQEPLLKSKEPHRFSVSPYTTADELFRQIATLLGETAEFPTAPQGDSIAAIAAAIKQRYPNPRPAWIWIENAHHLLDTQGFRDSKLRLLLMGLSKALGDQWHWLFELRERPPQGVLGGIANECEVPGLDKNSLKEWLSAAAPEQDASAWAYSGDELKKIYQWLGGGHGDQAHPLATQLLIEVAVGQNETPLQVLERHREYFDEGIENRLLGDLYRNVLNEAERQLLQAFALYRSAIPHDHVDILEHRLNATNAWEGLDRRCLLSSNAAHTEYYLHSFIAGWLRSRQLGYTVQSEEDGGDFAATTGQAQIEQTRSLHSAIAQCWLKQLGSSKRMTQLNISRALEAFHHLIAAGDNERIQHISVELLTGNKAWAQQRIEQLYNHLHKTHAPIAQLRAALEYAAHLNPDDHKVQRFLGECWAKEEGWSSDKALVCFENACRLDSSFPPYWANLGRALSTRGRDGAEAFLNRLDSLEQEHPKVFDDHVRSIQADCLKLVGDMQKAAALRMQYINAGSKHAAFYADEAKARLAAGDAAGALEILDLAQKNGCANDYTQSIRANALQQTDPEQAAALRMAKINAGSKDAAFYADEAKARLDAGNAPGALVILDKAQKNGCANEYTQAVRANALQQTDPEQAAALRMQYIDAGSKNAAFYSDEAKARFEAGDHEGALEILDKAQKNGCADAYTQSIRASILRR